MSQSAFVLPAGIDITIGDTLSIRHDGSVHLQQSFGKPLGTISAGGDLTIELATIGGTLRSGGKLKLDGKVDADLVHGREVHLGAQDIKARAISADERIVIGPAKLAVDVIIAPEVVIDPKASGRVTVIQSTTEVGPTKIKGGFSLAEYDEAVGDAESFLAERGLAELGARVRNGGTAPKPPPATKSPTPKTAPPPSAPKPIDAAPVPPPPEEDVDDPMSLSVEDLEPLPELDQPKDELHPKLMDAVKRIATCYEGKEVPPAVSQLRELVESRDYDRLRENITEVWNGLLGYHQKKGIRPHHQVTHAFNVIHGLVQQG